MPHRLRLDVLCRPAGMLVADHGRVVAQRVFVADRMWSRLVGMLGTPDPGRHEALVLVPCAAVHGAGLRADIGAAFVDGRGRVLRVVDPLPRRGARCGGAHAVVEAAAGVLDVRPGDRLRVTGVQVFPHGGVFGSRAGGSGVTARALSAHRGHSAPADDRRS